MNHILFIHSIYSVRIALAHINMDKLHAAPGRWTVGGSRRCISLSLSHFIPGQIHLFSPSLSLFSSYLFFAELYETLNSPSPMSGEWLTRIFQTEGKLQTADSV
jgi:hypothetical protein